MDLNILKKKISSYRTPKGKITSLPDDLLREILFSWEQWTGPASAFYRTLGVDYRKMGTLMGKAKQLKREGAFDGPEFAEVKIINHDVESASVVSTSIETGIEIIWKNKHPIRFSKVKDLITFLEHLEKTNSSVEIEDSVEAA